MQAEMLLQRYRTGKRDFSWAALAGADLSQMELTGINLYRANLAGANLAGTNLANANLFKVNLTGANLTGANLTEANLGKATLTDAVLENACLEATKLRGATLPDGSCYQPPEPPPESKPNESNASEVNASEANGAALAVPADQDTVEEKVEKSKEPLDSLPAFDDDGQPVSDEIADGHAHLQLQGRLDQGGIDKRLLKKGLLAIGAGYGCFGLVLGAHQSPLLAWFLVWATIFSGHAKLRSPWVVPIYAAATVMLCTGVSLGVLIFTALPIVMIVISMLFYGSILGSRLRQNLQNMTLLSALAFILMGMAPWVADGSNAYGGGGIVANLNSFYLFIFLVVGMVLTTFGCLFAIQDLSEFLGPTPQEIEGNDHLPSSSPLAQRKILLKQLGLTTFVGLFCGALGSLL